jgi:hypothetical protein
LANFVTPEHRGRPRREARDPHAYEDKRHQNGRYRYEDQGDHGRHRNLPRMRKPAGPKPSGRNSEHHLCPSVYHMFSNISS